MTRFTLCTQVIEKSFHLVPRQGSTTSEHLGEGIVSQALEVGENLRPDQQLTLNNTGEWGEVTSPSLCWVTNYQSRLDGHVRF